VRHAAAAVPARGRHACAGQALLPALLLLSACGLAWAALYNLGQVAAARLRLTHAADAAAYSAALEQARALNLLSYINRAQVAHQVAMAHLVTLATWARFSDTQARRRAMGNPPAYVIGTLFGAKAQSGYQAALPMPGEDAEAVRAYRAHDDLVHDVLAYAARQRVEHLPERRAAMLQAVLQANFPEFSSRPDILQWRSLADGWQGYVHRRAGPEGSALVRAAAGRYDFLQPRNITRTSDWIVDKRCPTKRHELRRRGETRMDDQGNWSSADSLSYHSLRSNRWIGCYYREYPMGWGLAGARNQGDVVQHAPEDFSMQDFWRWVMENTSWDIFQGSGNPLAEAYAAMARITVAGRGLPDFYEVPLERTPEPLRLAIAVRQRADSLPVSGGASKVALAGAFAWRAFGSDDGLTVTAAAETYYERPQARADGKSEVPTLFRPYWQARRAAVSEAEQARAGDRR